MGAKLTLIHVVTVPAGLQLDPYIVEHESLDVAPLEEAGSRILEKAKKIAKDAGVECETRQETVTGNPAQTVISVAETGRFDLIIIGAKGHSLIRNLTVGSVCDTVVHNASCPVLVVR